MKQRATFERARLRGRDLSRVPARRYPRQSEKATRLLRFMASCTAATVAPRSASPERQPPPPVQVCDDTMPQTLHYYYYQPYDGQAWNAECFAAAAATRYYHCYLYCYNQLQQQHQQPLDAVVDQTQRDHAARSSQQQPPPPSQRAPSGGSDKVLRWSSMPEPFVTPCLTCCCGADEPVHPPSGCTRSPLAPTSAERQIDPDLHHQLSLAHQCHAYSSLVDVMASRHERWRAQTFNRQPSPSSSIGTLLCRRHDQTPTSV